MLQKLLTPLWVLSAGLLLLYSFTQVDLSLTLSQSGLFQDIQKGFQYIGWFNRPLSTYLYIGIIVWLFVLFSLTINEIRKKKFGGKKLWITIFSVVVILIPSYNAFSYDLFNYIFDARIITHYGLNPYEYKPLDFSSDPMLSFMRSTHRVYPYGPSFLAVTAPLTLAANEVFALSLVLFKTLSALSFLGIAFLIGKIASKIKLENPNLAVAFFALNPLVIIESLVSAHNEVVMMFFALLGFYLMFENKKVFSVISLLFSIGIKYATVVFLPIYVLKIIFKKLDNKRVVEYSFYLSVFAVIATSFASGQNKGAEFQPWYLLLSAPFVALSENKLVRGVFLSICLFSLFSYIPYLYSGEWPEDIVSLKNTLVVSGLVLGGLFYFVNKKFNKLHD